MPPTPAPYASLALEPTTTVDRVADELRRALFAGELVPGQPLREVALAEALGVARSTVRESLGVLVGEGLVDRVPNKGTQVRALTAIAIRDICRARLVLESAGAAAWPAASESSRDEVRAALTDYARVAAADSTAGELTAAHLAVHRSLVALTQSPRLVAAAEALYAELRLALAGVDRARGNAQAQVRDHVELVDLLETGHVPDCLTRLGTHLADAETSLIETLPVE